MLSNATLSSHYLDFQNHNSLFAKTAPVADGKVLALLDVYALQIGEQTSVILIIPPFVAIDEFAERSRFLSSDGEEYSVTYEPYCRGARGIISAKSKDAPIYWQLGGETIELKPSESALAQFEGKNSALLYVNGDRADIVAKWVDYHQKYHALEAVCLIHALAPGQKDQSFQRDLETLLRNNPVEILLLPTRAPLGSDAPPARSVWQAPDAPGKDRMEEPKHDFWRSELGSSQIFEICRHRFLNHAKAVLHIAASDLLHKNGDGTIFDQCVASDEGYLQLFGERVFPWRVRKGEKVDFGDHCTHRFDSHSRNKQWIVDPQGAKKDRVWNLYRVGQAGDFDEDAPQFWRFMGLRHEDPKDDNPNLAPRTALVLDPELVEFVEKEFNANPVLPPIVEAEDAPILPAAKREGHRLIVTTMKNEGPFLLEWIAFHRAIGFDKFIIYTNDCTDGTDEFLDLLEKKGLVEHYDNPYRETGLKPQHAALFDAASRPTQKEADWVICMDCDEFVNIKTGNGTLDDLFRAVGDANMISLTWRLFGNSDVVKFHDKPIIEQFTECANEVTRFPHQAWGVKTIYRNLGYFKKMGVHRPKGLRPEYREQIKWVNGSGDPLPEKFIRNGWRTGLATYGYDLVQLNHYACRSMESFLVKRDRGRVNHVDRDQGLIYWFRMNHNPAKDRSILKHLPIFQAEWDRLMSDEDIAKQHHACVKAHKKRIDELIGTKEYQNFFDEINSERVRKLSRYVPHFGMNVFLAGPDIVSDKVLEEIDEGSRKYFNPPARMVSGDGH